MMDMQLSAGWGYSQSAYFIECLSEIFRDSHFWEADELSLNLYLKEVRRIKPIKYKGSEYYDFTKENEVIARAQNGDMAARQTIIYNNLRYVIQIAKKYQNRGLLLNDLISEGNIGLIEAIDKFDTSRGFSFRSHARYYVIGNILSALNKYGTLVHYPLHYLSNYLKVQKYIDRYVIQNGCKPTTEEIAQDLKIEESVVENCINPMLSDISLDEMLEYFCNSDDFEDFVNSSTNYLISFSDSLDIDEDVREESLAIDIEEVLNLLVDNEKDILKRFYGIGQKEQSLDEIAELYHLSKERIRQIRDKSIRKLKGTKPNNFRAYLN